MIVFVFPCTHFNLSLDAEEDLCTAGVNMTLIDVFLRSRSVVCFLSSEISYNAEHKPLSTTFSSHTQYGDRDISFHLLVRGHVQF